MKVGILLVQLMFIISGYFDTVKSVEDLIDKRGCEISVYAARTGMLNILFLKSFEVLVKSDFPGKTCKKLKGIMTEIPEECENYSSFRDNSADYIKVLEMKIDERMKILCTEGAYEKSLECIKSSGKESEIKSSCQDPFIEEINFTASEGDNFGKYISTNQIISYENTTTICCAIRLLACCYKKYLPHCKPIINNLIPILYEFVEFQLTGRIEENVCEEELICIKKSINSNSCRLQCLQPIIIFGIVTIMYFF